MDECQNVYVAKVLATGQTKTAYANLSLLQFPLSWVARRRYAVNRSLYGTPAF